MTWSGGMVWGGRVEIDVYIELIYFIVQQKLM